MYENAEKKERVILAAVCLGEEADTVDSLRELAALAETAGAEVVTSIYQNRDHPDPGTYLGKGKIQELSELLELLVGCCASGTSWSRISSVAGGFWSAPAPCVVLVVVV